MRGTEAALVLPAPAKLNLFLHVTGRRPDGYHTLETVFQLLDWGDEVALAPREDGRVVRHGGLPGLRDEDDLAVRAARLLQRQSGCRAGADIGIVKRIPAGAGLGGGSSDAATVLVGLNRLWRLDLSLPELARIGLALGADVPVFVLGRSAFATGIGEALTPVPLPARWYVVAWPGVAVSTAAVFQAPELTRNTPASTMTGLSGATTRNDLQPVAIRLCPAIGDVLTWLSGHGEARMSGSGSSVFVPVDGEETATALAARCPWPAWAVRGCEVSPLHRGLGLVAGESAANAPMR
jgi:4-diphosphocytidyl-2-C-methyl-D-erythritol kinase